MSTTSQTVRPPLLASERFWNKASRKYAASTIADMPGYERTLQRTHHLLNTTDRVLELGCGTASTALRLAPTVAHYTAADLSAAMVEIGREKLAAAAPEVQRRLQLAVADADSDLPAPATADGRVVGWDAVLAFNLLHLVPDLDHTLAQVLRLLQPGGLFISKTPCIGHMNPLVPRVALPVMRLLRLAPPVHVLTEDKLLAAIERSGLVIESVERHASNTKKGRDWRPFVVARKAGA